MDIIKSLNSESQLVQRLFFYGGDGMGNSRMDPSKQFSKKLAKWTAVFWFIYMAWLSAILIIQPATALYVVYLALITSVVMFVNVYSYCKNSIAEKVLLAFLDKAQIEFSAKGGEANDEAVEEGGGNG